MTVNIVLRIINQKKIPITGLMHSRIGKLL